jgi:uncharacterized protein YecE (DUF72 family)
MKKVYIGTSGYSYRHWKDTFYPTGLPPREWLRFYGEKFNTLDVNATFYRSFGHTVFERWYSLTPEQFCFAIKGSRLITHQRKLVGVEEDVRTFFEQACGLGEKLGIVLWQFPASFRCSEENFEKVRRFLGVLPREVRQVFELRDTSWFTDEVYTLLDSHCAGFVINDTSAFATDIRVTGGFGYIRFHGPGALYASSYSDEALMVWAARIGEYIKEYDVYCYFNNDIIGHAIANANCLKELVGDSYGRSVVGACS